MVNDLKKELSKLSGVDFFNPKFRDVFKKYFPNDNNENDANTNEEERLQETIGEENEENMNNVGIEKEEEKSEDTEENVNDESVNDETQTVEEETAAENVVDEVAEEKPAKEVASEVPTEDKAVPKNDSGEILELKLELELIKANIRKDRLEAAKQLFTNEIHSIDDLEKLPSLVAKYPEWVNKEKSEVKPFGMPVADMGDGLTEEEKRLKSMGIDPRA